jgi:hypothetical protein
MELNPIDIPGVKSQLLMFYVISSKKCNNSVLAAF